MKGYYLFAPVESENAGPESGVERKVRAQHKALQSMVDCELVILDPVQYTGSVKEKILRRLPFTAAWRKWEYHGEFRDADFLYIRQVEHDDSFTRYLRSIRQDNPDIKIIYEVPTYPYGVDTKYSLSNFAFLLKDRICRWSAAKYMDRIVTFYGQDKIWNVPCIKTMNGFDFSTATLPRRQLTETVEIISVSQTAFWHGYERIIEGLHQYYKSGGTVNFVYHMVGGILTDHVKMVKEYGLESHVIFHGKQTGTALQDIYAMCSLGIDVLAGHKIDYPVSSSLKSREYGAYGIPFITASPVDYMDEGSPYQLIVPYDDSPVDMNAVLNFYNGIYKRQTPDQVAQNIRSYARQRCDMHVTMRVVVDYILGQI